MAKKIKLKKEPTAEERKAAEAKAAEDAAKAAAGIQDEFQARGFELVEWVHEKQSIFLAMIAVLVGGGLAFGVYNMVQTNRNTEASATLTTALEAFEAPIGEEPTGSGPSFADASERATKARELFEKTASEHKGTGAGDVAHLYAGHASMKLADYDAAARHYQAFLDASGRDDPLRFAGLSGLAAALEAKGDRKGAIARLEELVNLPAKIDEDAALLELARLQQAEGNVEAARSALERIAKDFPESSLKTRADELLATLQIAAASGSPAVPPTGGGGDPSPDPAP
jgi:tetratricopeptide (TPR) repeat protein